MPKISQYDFSQNEDFLNISVEEIDDIPPSNHTPDQ